MSLLYKSGKFTTVCVSQKGLEGTSLTKARNMLVKGRTRIVRSPVISVLCRPGLTGEDAKVGFFPQEGEINCLNFQRLGLAAGGGGNSQLLSFMPALLRSHEVGSQSAWEDLHLPQGYP